MTKIEQLLAPEESQKELENLPSDELKKMAKERDEMAQFILRKISLQERGRPSLKYHPRFATEPESTAESTGWFSWWK